MQPRLSRSFLPDRPDATMRARQRQTFFGSSVGWSAAILTPISAIYSALPDGEPLTGGWWPAKTWEGVLVAVMPQASAILDPVCALEPTTTVLFIGFTGALSTYSVGDVMEPSTALLDGRVYATGRRSTSPYPDARVVTVRCLNESMQRRDELADEADVVDMEAAWVCAATDGERSPARVVLIVSDELRGRTFIDVKLDDLGAAITRLGTEIAEQITEGTRSRP